VTGVQTCALPICWISVNIDAGFTQNWELERSYGFEVLGNDNAIIRFNDRNLKNGFRFSAGCGIGVIF
jgi:hypothetical protein